MIKKLALTLALASISASAAASVVVFSENFESYTTGLTGSGAQFQTYGSTLGPWSIAGTVDTIKGGYGAISGISLDLDGSPGNGATTTTIATIIGNVYQLNFDYSGNGGARPFNVSFGSLSYGPLSSGGVTSFASGFFTATTTTTTLTFQGISPDVNNGGTIDNITVTNVPEPGVLALLMAGLAVGGLVTRRNKKK